MRRLLLFSFLLAASAQSPAPLQPTIESADQAAFNSDFATARRLYASVAKQASDPKDRDRAEVTLANIEWRIDANLSAARTRLDALETSDALIERSRLERESGRFAEAEWFARKAIGIATKPDDRRSAETSLVRAIVAGHVAARLNGAPVPPSDLKEAFTVSRRLVDANRGQLVPALLLLDASLLLGEGASALDAWHAYFGGTAQSTLLAPAAATLENTLPKWHGAPSPEIAAALAASRLFDEAVLAGAKGDVDTYAKYIRRVKALTDSYYRDVANHRANARSYRKSLERETRAVYDALHIPWDRKAIEGGPDTPLGARFGSVIAAGKTGDTFNLHFGHCVVDDRRKVTQYGRSAPIRYILLENMVSNGFETWSWDGGAEHGGWGDVGLIVQVRRAYAGDPITKWRRAMDPDARAEEDEKIEKETAADWKRAAADPAGFLPGLQRRMSRDAALRLVHELRAKGLQGDALHDAFVAEYAWRVNESSIFAHEGRHAIDAQFKPVNSAQAEFQAKLSEIAFAPDPALALTGGIITSNIGSSSPHGVANGRIMKGLVAWMTAHKGEIAGLDATQPLLPQLDKLTADQLRAAARSMDPYAK